MNGLQRKRMLAPVLTAAVGVVLTIGVLIAAGWAAASPVAAITAVSTSVYYWLGGTQTDVGALIASRADERQSAVRLWVRAFAAAALLVLATIGAVVSTVLHSTAWPYTAIAGLGAVCFLGGLAVYHSSGRVSDSGLSHGAGSRLDEREATVVLKALQIAGIVMFLAAIIGGLALSGTPGADPLRILASAFAAAVIAGLVIFRPRQDPRR